MNYKCTLDPTQNLTLTPFFYILFPELFRSKKSKWTSLMSNDRPIGALMTVIFCILGLSSFADSQLLSISIHGLCNMTVPLNNLVKPPRILKFDPRPSIFYRDHLTGIQYRVLIDGQNSSNRVMIRVYHPSYATGATPLNNHFRNTLIWEVPHNRIR